MTQWLMFQAMMLGRFDFFSVPRIVFGCGEIRRVGELVAGMGQTALVIYSGSAAVDSVVEDLKGAEVRCVLRRQARGAGCQ